MPLNCNLNYAIFELGTELQGENGELYRRCYRFNMCIRVNQVDFVLKIRSKTVKQVDSTLELFFYFFYSVNPCSQSSAPESTVSCRVVSMKCLTRATPKHKHTFWIRSQVSEPFNTSVLWSQLKPPLLLLLLLLLHL